MRFHVLWSLDRSCCTAESCRVSYHFLSLHPPPPQSDLLLGILDILDPELFLRVGEQEPQGLPELGGAGADPVPAPPSAPVGPAPAKLEALNELIHFDHIYTKPVEVVCVEQCEDCIPDVKMEAEEDVEETTTTTVGPEVVVVETVSVKDEPEEEAELIQEVRTDDFLSSASPPLAHPDKASSSPYLMDTYSDSGYERSPSPFSNMSSPLCPDGGWDDDFAIELFPQLISV